MIRKLSFVLFVVLISCTTEPTEQTENGIADLKLKNYHPVSIYNIQKTEVSRAAVPVIDMHSHDYAENAKEIDEWIETMDQRGITKTTILSMQSGSGFDEVVAKYAKYPDKFDLWCGLDYTGYDTDENWIQHAIEELERCHDMGAKGVGELGDKGEGLLYSKPTAAYGLHLDDPMLQALWAKCAELNMPVNVHIAEPKWMYETMDASNDGLMNAYNWKVDMSKEGILDHGELIHTLENALKENPNTTFIACHFANCSYDLEIIGDLLDKYPNLLVDNAARYAETSPIPRRSKAFYESYADRILYGTDMGLSGEMYKTTFRILETKDEHFYKTDLFGYHWALNGFGLPKEVLEKIYRTNALKIIDHE